MNWRNSEEHWGAVAKFLHWTIALLIVLLAIIGWRMISLPNSPDKIFVYAMHKSFGITVLALVAIRLAWRLFAGAAPKPPASFVGWQRGLSGFVHFGLYAVMIAMPLSGWIFNSASNFPLKWFNTIRVPAIVGADPQLKAFAQTAHLWLFWALAVLVFLHVAGALKHHFVDRDDVLRKMLPGRRAKAAVAKEIAAPASVAQPEA